MKIDRALDQIDEIYGHLAKTEVYRGYRPLPVALTGGMALAGGLVQSWVLPDPSPVGFVVYWVAMALFCSVLVSADIVHDYFFAGSSAQRRTSRRVLGQFLPCVAAGGATTAVLVNSLDTLIVILPGLWAMIFSLGIFASRPYLPRAIGWVGLYYFLAGCLLLGLAESGASLKPWGMSTTFGFGQLFASLVLYRNLERTDNGCEKKGH